MKNILLIAFILIPTITVAGNPMFEHHDKNSISIYIAQSTGHGDLGHLFFPWEWEINPMTMIMAQYSQPISLFRLPGRVNLTLLQNFSYNSERGKSFAALGISWDVLLFSKCGWYVGVGIGPYMRDSGDDYVESRLVFGEKVFVGKNINSVTRLEFFTQHFSNGDFTDVNHGFNFIGMGINHSF